LPLSAEAEEARVLQEQRAQIEQLRVENRQMQEQLNVDPKVEQNARR
jgi:hypothetical protein